MASIDSTSFGSESSRQARLRGNLRKVARYVGDQGSQVHPKVLLATTLLAPLPNFAGGHIRAAVFRAIGFEIGRGSGFYGTPRIYGRGNLCGLLKIGHHTWFNIDCHLDLSAPITIGNGVGIALEVMILTGTHELGSEDQRVGRYIADPVTIEDGVWVGARCMIMPGVRIGRGSVIAAGSVVNRDVPPNTMVVGTQRMPLDKWMALMKNNTQASPASLGA